MRDEWDGSEEKDVVRHSDEDDEAFVRRLKLVREIERPRPPPSSRHKEWIEFVLVICVLLFTLYCFSLIVLWFYNWVNPQ